VQGGIKMTIRVGDIVARKSYECDLLFRVQKIVEEKQAVELIGEEMRLIADAPLNDLIVISASERQKLRQALKEKEDRSFRLFRQDYQLLRRKREYTATNGYQTKKGYFELPGKVLHIDGDPLYLNKCLEVYKRLAVPVFGVHMNEADMPQKVPPLLDKVRPEVLVITGHDAYLKNKGKKNDLQAYRHSKHFVRTVKEVRAKIGNLDHLVIFAGACQSHFESLIKAGANFASSPTRVNIHALDPVYIVSKICLASFMDRVNVIEVLRNTLTGEEGLGGVETRGLLRTGMPLQEDEETLNDQT
jgi:spore coat assemly protein